MLHNHLLNIQIQLLMEKIEPKWKLYSVKFTPNIASSIKKCYEFSQYLNVHTILCEYTEYGIRPLSESQFKFRQLEKKRRKKQKQNKMTGRPNEWKCKKETNAATPAVANCTHPHLIASIQMQFGLRGEHTNCCFAETKRTKWVHKLNSSLNCSHTIFSSFSCKLQRNRLKLKRLD